jgi:glycosyltransferase involved in cell wall biosynthesis
MHRFSRPSGPKYPLTVEEKLRNYLIGHTELGLDLTPVIEHFSEHLSPDRVMAVTKQVLGKPWTGRSNNGKQTVSAKKAQAPSPTDSPETVRVVTVSRHHDSANSVQSSGGEKAPLVSVVLPVYNGARYLRAAVESLLGQSLQNIEIIIINDGSTDQTQEIINELMRDPRVRTEYQSNRGMAQARNRGIALARARYIAAHDDDDISLPDRLQKQYTFLEQAPDCGMIGAYMELIDEAGRVFRSPGVQTDPHTLKVVMVEPARLLERNHFVHGSVMMRKSACEAAGNYRDEFLLADDYDLWLRIAEKYPVGNLADVLYQYRDHPESISKKNVQLLQVYTQIAIGLARERQESGSDLLMREGTSAFWDKYGAQLKAGSLPASAHEPAVAL